MPSSQEPTVLQAAAQAQLRRHGAMDLAALAARLLAEGFDLGEEPEAFLDDELVERDDLDELPDGRQLDLATTVDGAVATTRLTAEEITTALVQVEPELELLLLPDVDAFPLPDGHSTELALRGAGEDRGADLGVWLASGPPGWLDHLRAGELAAFRLTGGVLHVEPAGTLADPDEAVGALADSFAEQSADGEPIETRQLLLAVLVDRPHVLSEPLPPLTDLLDAAGLETDGDWVGEQGTEWGADDEAWAYGLDAGGREALGIVLAGFTLSLEEGPDELAARPDLAEGLAACLSYDGVAEAFLAKVLAEADETQAAATAGWASLLSGMASSQPGPHLVLAGCAEHAGDVESGQRALAEALRVDPESPAALRDAAWYAEDRGDAAGALTLLRRAGVEPDDPDVQRLERFAAPGPMAAGRNEPCPCGSGRKYKVCCAVRDGYPLHTRVPWLLAKAGTYARRPAVRPLVAAVAVARTGGDPEDLAWIEAAVGDPLVIDLVLFEEGALEDFCDVRGPLLPADELALARSWVGVRPSVYEVTEVTRGEGVLALRDLATGEPVRLTDRAGAAELETGALLFAHLLPVGERCVIAPGVLQIAFTLRDRLLAFLATDPDGFAIATWLAAAQAPPTLHTTDGDPLVDCLATFRVADPAAAADTPPPESALPGDEGTAEALDAFMQQAERRWIDESVPALGGVTPRQAADDPTRRGDLERLLAEFEAAAAGTPAGMGTFDVARLRRLLGLA